MQLNGFHVIWQFDYLSDFLNANKDSHRLLNLDMTAPPLQGRDNQEVMED